jgi:hypothetical protein
MRGTGVCSVAQIPRPPERDPADSAVAQAEGNRSRVKIPANPRREINASSDTQFHADPL